LTLPELFDNQNYLSKRMPMGGEPMKCPRCDAPRQPDDTECPQCGIDIAYVEKKMARTTHNHQTEPDASDDGGDPWPEPPPETDSADSARDAEGREEVQAIETRPFNEEVDTKALPTGGSTPCPKCDFANPDGVTECLRCGIIFKKYERFIEKKRRLLEEASHTTDGLIDPEDLRSAMEQAEEAVGEPKSETVKTACPHCRQRYRIRPDQIGITTRCKKCSSIFKIEALTLPTP
jgi:predicted Zn finger-like uncharacterized protein